MKVSKYVVLLLVLSMASVCGCAESSWFCKNRPALTSTFNLAQAGYDDYVKMAQAGNTSAASHLVVADQILSIAGPFLVAAGANACPPNIVVEAAQEKAEKLKVPLAP